MYLMKYGYMDNPMSSAKTANLLSRDGLRDYIMEFQSFAGLNMTGELDNQTIRLMNMPRYSLESRQSQHSYRYCLEFRQSEHFRYCPEFRQSEHSRYCLESRQSEHSRYCLESKQSEHFMYCPEPRQNEHSRYCPEWQILRGFEHSIYMEGS